MERRGEERREEATTFFYNCVFNLMDSLMRFVVLSLAARELAGEEERGREGGRGRKRGS